MKENKEEKTIETDDGMVIRYDFSGFENFKAAEEMKKGKTGKLIGIGNSMTPILKSRQPVIVSPIKEDTVFEKEDILFCKVRGNYYLHKLCSMRVVDGNKEQFLIGNNHGHMNGWINRDKVFGKVTYIIPC